jgi:hypothetical protein
MFLGFSLWLKGQQPHFGQCIDKYTARRQCGRREPVQLLWCHYTNGMKINPKHLNSSAVQV